MNDSKRYVFERPLLTVMALIAIAQFIDVNYLAFLPCIAILLFIFNLWFTHNRLRSASRIASYIQVVLESPTQDRWVGWETFLRFFRMWSKETPREKREEILRTKMSQQAVPDALFYYPAIFVLHVIVVVLAMVLSIIATANAFVTANIVGVVASLIGFLYFLHYCLSVRPSKMRGLIEEYRVICEEVLKYMDQKKGLA